MVKTKIYDNGGTTFDRYTVIINDDVYGMSTNATSPHGFNQYCCPRSELLEKRASLGTIVEFGRLPDEVKKAIIDRMGETVIEDALYESALGRRRKEKK